MKITVYINVVACIEIYYIIWANSENSQKSTPPQVCQKSLTYSPPPQYGFQLRAKPLVRLLGEPSKKNLHFKQNPCPLRNVIFFLCQEKNKTKNQERRCLTKMKNRLETGRNVFGRARAEIVLVLFLTAGFAAIICLLLLVLPNSNNQINHTLS